MPEQSRSGGADAGRWLLKAGNAGGCLGPTRVLQRIGMHTGRQEGQARRGETAEGTPASFQAGRHIAARVRKGRLEDRGSPPMPPKRAIAAMPKEKAKAENTNAKSGRSVIAPTYIFGCRGDEERTGGNTRLLKTRTCGPPS